MLPERRSQPLNAAKKNRGRTGKMFRETCRFKKAGAALLIGVWTLILSGAPAQKKDILREKASSGDGESAFYLGNEYFYGENRPKNHTLAAYWYLKAAEKGIPEAQFNYASCLETGKGTKASLPEAFAWYKKAADQNFDPAVFRIARFYTSGFWGERGLILLKPALETALRMLEKLADRQYLPAEMELAAMRMGKSKSQTDHRQAFTLLSRITARKNCPPAALRMLADCYFSGFGCTRDRAKAADLLKTAGDRGDSEALAKLGFLHEYGNTVRQDQNLSREYYRKAAEAGHPMAQFKYAEAMAEGVFPGKNLNDALVWYQKSASAGCPQALFKLGVFYHDGTGVKPDKNRAARLFYRAAKMGYPRAQHNLACLFAEGTVTGKPDKEAAFYWFLQAAQSGDVMSQKRVAECYLNGSGVERSISKAEKWLLLAVQNGDMDARRLLYELQRSGSGSYF